MLDSITASVISTELTLSSLLLSTAISLVLGLGIAILNMKTNRYTKSFSITLTLLPAMVQIVIMLVNGNLGAGVAVAGAFSLIRFRSVPGSARDIGTIFFAMAIGLATGMGFLLYASLFFLILGAATLLLSVTRFGEEKQNIRTLKVTIPESLDYQGIFDDLFAAYTDFSELEKVKTTNLGSLYELTYNIRLKAPHVPKEFIDGLRTRNGNLNIVCGRPVALRDEL